MCTLILNADASPISIIPLSVSHWKDAVKLYYQDRASVISEYDIAVHSPSVSFNIPKIMISREYIQPPTNVKFSKDHLLLRDEFKCQYCGVGDSIGLGSNLTMDHVIPRKNGGRTTWENIVMSCIPCNSKKGHRTDWKPVNKPYRPNYFQLYNKRKKFPIQIADNEWRSFIDFPDDKIILVEPEFKFDISLKKMVF